MSLCIVCKSIPFRKIINRDEEAIVNDGFRFNLVGRTSPGDYDDSRWNQRRCAVSELVSRAKTCRLCEFLLLSIKKTTWVSWDPKESMTWEEAKTSISPNLMIWIDLFVHQEINPSFFISLGNLHEQRTWQETLDFRKSLSKSFST